MKDCFRCWWVLSPIAMLLATICVAEDPFFTEASSDKAIELLESDAPLYRKAKAFQQLAVIGDASAVGVLAEYLDDPRLSGYARTALERIPGPEAEQALVKALGTLEGRQLIGVIDSVGERQIVAAVAPLEKRLDDGLSRDAEQNRELAQAVMRALERLKQAETPQPASVDALQGRLARVLSDEESPNVKDDPSEKTRDGAEAVRAMLTRARQQGPDAASSVANQLDKLSPIQQVLVLECLAELGNKEVVPRVQPLLESPDDAVAEAAFETLVKLGHYDESKEIPETLRIRSSIADVGLAALANRSAVELDSAVIEELKAAGDELDLAWLRGLARYVAVRHLTPATPALLELAESSEGERQTIALVAAGSTVSASQFPKLLRQTSELISSLSTDTANQVLQRALVRLPRKEAAESIAEMMDELMPEGRASILQHLAFLGGPDALAVVAAEARSGNDERVDAATQALGQWTTADVADTLLELARQIESPNYRLRTLRGYLRVLRQFELPLKERTDRAIEAYSVATRDAERLLVLDVFRRHPSMPALQWLVQRISDSAETSPRVRNQMFRTLTSVASRVAQDSPKQVLNELSKIEVAVTDLRSAQQQELSRLIEDLASQK